MDSYRVLKERIEKGEARICIMGLGYVGLPLVLAFAKKGFKVFGYDTNRERIKKLKRGQSYISDIDPQEVFALINKKKFIPTSEEKILSKVDVIIICVPTPLRKVKIPDISYIVKATQTISKYLKTQLIILESTSFPTTTRQIILPIMEKSSLKVGKDFFLCFSPERVNPGDRKYQLRDIPRIVGGTERKSAFLAKELYSKIIKKVFIVSSCEVAEAAKLLENTFRLVNIGLVNEFALLCHRLRINIWEVIEAAKTKPFGFMPFYPGAGVGGHCIPQDPLYLSWKAEKIGFKTKMIDLASYINHYMPKYVVKRVKEILKKRKINLKKVKVLVLGVTYKKDVRDLRESPALEVIELLKKENMEVSYFDPLIPYLKIHNLNLKRVNLTEKLLKKYHCIILITDHSSLDYEFIRKNSQFIFDTRNVYKDNYSNIEKL